MKEKLILITHTHESTQSLLIFPFSENHGGGYSPRCPPPHCGATPDVDDRLKNLKKTVLLLKLSKFGLVHSFAPDFFSQFDISIFSPQLLYFEEETQTLPHMC